MNHEAIASALCGRYVRLSDGVGYIESNLAMPSDGKLIGAYVVDAGEGRYRVTDDGDTAFSAAVAGAEITPSRAKTYMQDVAKYGLEMERDGTISAICVESELPKLLSNFLLAAHGVALRSVKHRPGDEERFEELIGSLLLHSYPKRLVRRPTVTGLSGNQLRFPFALDFRSDAPHFIQTVAARDEKVNWHAVYEAGGKFKDAIGALATARITAVIEAASGVDKAVRYFADSADVVVYEGGTLDLAA